MLLRAQAVLRGVQARSASSSGSKQWESVGVQEAHQLWEDGGRTYLDVRTAEEFNKV
jgi:hypothetical protein